MKRCTEKERESRKRQQRMQGRKRNIELQDLLLRANTFPYVLRACAKLPLSNRASKTRVVSPGPDGVYMGDRAAGWSISALRTSIGLNLTQTIKKTMFSHSKFSSFPNPQNKNAIHNRDNTWIQP